MKNLNHINERIARDTINLHEFCKDRERVGKVEFGNTKVYAYKAELDRYVTPVGLDDLVENLVGTHFFIVVCNPANGKIAEILELGRGLDE